MTGRIVLLGLAVVVYTASWFLPFVTLHHEDLRVWQFVRHFNLSREFYPPALVGNVAFVAAVVLLALGYRRGGGIVALIGLAAGMISGAFAFDSWLGRDQLAGSPAAIAWYVSFVLLVASALVWPGRATPGAGTAPTGS